MAAYNSIVQAFIELASHVVLLLLTLCCLLSSCLFGLLCTIR